jgi:hypothetical protein
VAGKLRKRAKPKAAPVQRHQSRSPLDVLKQRGSLNVWELTAADEIIAAHAMASGQRVVRDADLGIPAAEPRPGAADDAAARRSDLTDTLARWKRTLGDSWPKGVTIRVLIEERRLADVDDYCGWRKGTAKEHLLTGLRHFAALRGNVPRGVRGWKLEGSAAA